MSSTYKTLTAITAWICFISGVLFVILPIVLGLASNGLAGTINDVEAGQLWFYRHGLSFLLGVVFFAVFCSRSRCGSRWTEPVHDRHSERTITANPGDAF